MTNLLGNERSRGRAASPLVQSTAEAVRERRPWISSPLVLRMLQLSSSSAATSLREEAELLHIWIDRLPCSEAGDVGEEAKSDDHIFDRAGDPVARPGGTPGATELWSAACALAPSRCACVKTWILKAVIIFSAASSCIEEGSQL